MQGISGIRATGRVSIEPGSHTSNHRFDLQGASGVAGLRTLEQWCQRTHGVIEPDDSLAGALQRCGLEPEQVFSLVQALKGIFDFRHCHRGDQFELLRSPAGTIERFIYRKSPLVHYRVDRQDQTLSGRQVAEKADVEVVPIALRIKDSLYASLEQANESAALVMMLVDIFAWDIDFYTDTQEDDLIRLLVEKIKVNGRFVRYGRILTAEYRGAVGEYRAFWYQTADDRDGYYDQNGGSLRKAFLKSPLMFTRISSGFGMRVHPILGFSKMHLGIDLSAPRGTPVWAPADGTILSAGRQGVSGKLATLRHANGYQTVYAHLQAIAPGVRRGVRIRQKQVIGWVGSTGRSTGPHLHYSMKLNGRHINPFKQRFPPARPVPKSELVAYQAAIAPLIKQLEAIPIPPASQTASVLEERKETG